MQVIRIHKSIFMRRNNTQAYRLKVYFKSIKNIEYVNEKKRDGEYLAAGLLLPPVALGYL